MLPFYRRPITAKTVLMVLLIPLVSVAVPALLWLGWSARPLNIAREFDIPTPDLPSPNAHDLYEKAYKEFGARRSRKPVALIIDATADQNVDEDVKKYPLEGKKNWINQNRAGLKLINQALQTEYYFPPVRSAQPYGELERPSFLYWLARYAAVECEVLAAEGHSEKAVDRAIDIWKMGLDGAQGASLPVAMNATKSEYLSYRILNKEIAHLNGTQARLAANRLEKLLSKRVTNETILREDRNAMLFQIKPMLETKVRNNLREKKIDAAFKRGEEYNFPDSEYGVAPELRGPLINWTVRRLANEYARSVELLFANADAPWLRRRTSLPTDLRPEIAKLVSVLEGSRFFFAKPQTLGNIALARLALHAYRKDNGVYPPSLESLSPKYLAKAPLDPFSDNQILRYKRVGKRYKLWSIGPDGRDDDARPALNPAPRKPTDRYLIVVDSTGDMVASISK